MPEDKSTMTETLVHNAPVHNTPGSDASVSDAPVPDTSATHPLLREQVPEAKPTTPLIEAPTSHKPVSHRLTHDQIQTWKQRIKYLRHTPIFLIKRWPCMYCLGNVDINGLRDCAWFRCQREECIGRGKLQVTCFWDAKGEREWVE